jgi:hypothetical protein
MQRYATIDANRIRGRTTATCGPDNTALVVIDMQTDFCGSAAMSTRWATTSR